ncbi:mechanosensitive ion channel family protein [Synechococcus sp. 8F6]|uniref:mechanosensitive ion channel family protein n=1 Tax=Synechococcus sp. 8F6 TaxID=2025606 RepID=UPI000B9819FE|nr:mechanosensitive ion channel domain-containing protein [Synechococcus sp. 8F6]
MRELLLEVLGWLGYLERPAVLLQLAVVIGLMVLRRFAARRNWLRQLRPRAYTPLALVVLAASCLLLALLGLPYGLSGQLGMLWLGWYALNLLQPLLQRRLGTETARQLDSRLLRPAYLLLAALMLISSLDSIRDLAVAPLGSVLGVPVDAGKLFNAGLITYLVLVGSGPPAAGVAWLVQRALATSDSSRKAMELMLRYTVVGLGLVGVGMHLGLNTTALIAVAGGLSVGLGFGIKEVFSNFVSGLWLLFEGSVRPGEVLLLDDDHCEVRKLGLRATLLWRDRDNAELLIPNQTFFTEATTSYTASDRMRRCQVDVGAAYHHDPHQVIALLEATALGVDTVLAEPAPKGLLLSYGDFAINYGLRFWIANPIEAPVISSAVNLEIWRAFKQQGIEIPFPQQVEYSMVWPPEQHRPNVDNH